ncbi:MAG: hypothetical protein ABI165_12340, partial [Bryobacteraceae bacterium]
DVSGLVAALGDKQPMIRRSAAFALKRIGDKRAAGPLLERFLMDGREGSLDQTDIRVEIKEIGVTDYEAHTLLQSMRGRLATSQLRQSCDWVLGNLRPKLEGKNKVALVQKLKELGFYDELLLHSGEFASVSKQEQCEILKAVHPDLSADEVEKLRKEIIEDAQAGDLPLARLRSGPPKLGVSSFTGCPSFERNRRRLEGRDRRRSPLFGARKGCIHCFTLLEE